MTKAPCPSPSLRFASNASVLVYLRRKASRRSESLNLISLLLISMHEDFCKSRFQFIPIDITGDNGTVGGKENGMRKGIYTIECGRNVLSIDDLWIWDAEITDSFFCFLGFVAEGNAKHCQSFLLILLIETNQVGYLLTAWAAPRSPEVSKNILASSHIIT